MFECTPPFARNDDDDNSSHLDFGQCSERAKFESLHQGQGERSERVSIELNAACFQGERARDWQELTESTGSTILENRKKLDWIDPLPSCHGLHAPLKVNANERASAIMFTLAPLHGASIGGARIHAHQLRADPPPYHPIATHRLLLGTHKQVVARTSSGTGSSGS